jgi:hypothetical protein
MLQLRSTAIQLSRESLQTLHTPNIQFEIHQIALNPSGKLLAVAGAFQVAVVVLPRAGYNRLVPDSIDCKYAYSLYMIDQSRFNCIELFKLANSIMHLVIQPPSPKLNGIRGVRLGPLCLS